MLYAVYYICYTTHVMYFWYILFLLPPGNKISSIVYCTPLVRPASDIETDSVSVPDIMYDQQYTEAYSIRKSKNIIGPAQRPKDIVATLIGLLPRFDGGERRGGGHEMYYDGSCKDMTTGCSGRGYSAAIYCRPPVAGI
jgi:hypothetical protein